MKYYKILVCAIIVLTFIKAPVVRAYKLAPVQNNSSQLQPLPANAQPNVSGNIQYNAGSTVQGSTSNINATGQQNPNNNTTAGTSTTNNPETKSMGTSYIWYIISFIIFVGLLFIIWRALNTKKS